MFDKAARKKAVIVVCIAVAAGSGWASDQNIESQYSTLKDEYQKKEFLLQLREKSKQKKVKDAPQDTSEQVSIAKVLERGLSEESPVVVEQAVIGIGKIRCTSLTSHLIPLYRNAQKRFGGYAERIRIAVVGTLGIMERNAESIAFLGEVLNKDNGTILGQKILVAIKELQDEKLSGVVSKYAEKMESQVESGRKQGHDPMLYSNALHNATLAREVLSSLTTR